MDNDDDSEMLDLLNDLISNNTEDHKEAVSDRTLKELDVNFLDIVPAENGENSTDIVPTVSEIHDEKIDSSDEEDRRYFEEQKYSDSGRDLKHLLKKRTTDKAEYPTDGSFAKSRKSFDIRNTNNNTKVNNENSKATTSKDVYSDPCFGIRIINPLISSAQLMERMTGRTAVTVSKIRHHLSSDNVHNDWVIAGVLINQSLPRTSQKGSTYCIWKISDLSENINTVSMFLFSGAYKAFWKTTPGTVVGVLNPNVLDSKDKVDQATLSVDNPQKIMIFGKSKDMGKCRSTKKNGDPCTSIVNLSRCEFCIYHVKQEYKKCSQRADLQSNNNGQRFSADNFKNKPSSSLNKLFPQGMHGFTPVLAKKNTKLYEKDQQRLTLLSQSSNSCSKVTNTDGNEKVPGQSKAVASTSSQIKKHYEHANKSRGWRATTQVMLESSEKFVTSPCSPAQSRLSSALNTTKATNSLNNLTPSSSTPRLGVGCSNGQIDFSVPVTKKHINRAKMNALKWVQENGGIKAKDPNSIKPSKETKTDRGVKRQREGEGPEEKSAKKPAGLSDKFKEMLEAKSSHEDLIEKTYEEEKEKYFNKLEMKERMEEKMMTTYKIECKAVTCLICKYTAFSASDTCKEQKHPLRVLNAIKRFFKCSDCGNRTVCLDRIPSYSCTKCRSSNWTKAAMMNEKKVNIIGASLSVRGDEEKFIGSTLKEANLNLLVPDSDS